MSWAAEYVASPKKGLVEKHRSPGLDVEQFKEALDAAMSLIVSGAFGDDTKTFYIRLSGHSNPNHEPRSGWANDSVVVSVSQGDA